MFWKKKKKIEKYVETISTKEIKTPISEVDKIISETKSLRQNVLLQQAKPIGDIISEKRDFLLEIISRFENDTLKIDDVDIHLRIQIKRRKNLVISGIKKETSINLPKIENSQDVIVLNANAAKMLKRIGDILGKDTRIMHDFAKKYASRLKSELEVMTSEQEQLQNQVDNFTKLESNISDAEQGCNSILQSQNEINTKSKKIVEIEKNLEGLNSTIENLKKEVEEFKSSVEYQEFLTVKNEIDSLSSEETTIKNQIDLQFSKISRPLGKYRYISALEKPVIQLMEKLFHNPSDTLNSENKDSIIQILESVNKAVTSGSVSVKDTQKSIQQIQETIEQIDELISTKSKFSDKKNSLETRLDSIDLRKIKINENNIKESSEKKIQNESYLETLKKEIEDAKKRIPHLIIDTENKLEEITGKKMYLQV